MESSKSKELSTNHSLRRPVNARESVSSSTNSKSPPSGIPDAKRDTVSDGKSFNRRAKYDAVASPSVSVSYTHLTLPTIYSV